MRRPAWGAQDTGNPATPPHGLRQLDRRLCWGCARLRRTWAGTATLGIARRPRAHSHARASPRQHTASHGGGWAATDRTPQTRTTRAHRRRPDRAPRMLRSAVRNSPRPRHHPSGAVWAQRGVEPDAKFPIGLSLGIERKRGTALCYIVLVLAALIRRTGPAHGRLATPRGSSTLRRHRSARDRAVSWSVTVFAVLSVVMLII